MVLEGAALPRRITTATKYRLRNSYGKIYSRVILRPVFFMFCGVLSRKLKSRERFCFWD